MPAVYIHGTNGAGKTTLARALMICTQGAIIEATVKECPVTISCRPMMKDVCFIGKYRTATGGMDTVQPYAAGVEAAIARGKDFGDPVVMESLITPGIDTCKQLSKIPGLVFFWLDTPVEQCIRNTLARRAARGNDNEFDPSNLERKAQSVASWYKRLQEAGLNVERGNWEYVYARCKQILDITEPDGELMLL